MTKRVFDIVSSLAVIAMLGWLFFAIVLAVISGSRGGVFYRQVRVGKNGKLFRLYKFRTMYAESDKSGQITLGTNDSRITAIGKILRKYKLDEFPQLINVLKGEMSVVGPRPEVPEYVALYSDEQKKVLEALPGLTDYASLEYINENELLEKSTDPLKTYREEIMPAKLALNLKYISEQNFSTDLKIIFRTIKKILV